MARSSASLEDLVAAARAALIAAIARDTPGTDLPRYVAVLDALLAWSAARPHRVALRPDAARGTLRCDHVGATTACWAVRVPPRAAPTLELFAPGRAGAGAIAGTEARAAAVRILNAHATAVLVAGDRLRIGFGALKNADALAAVLALMDDLLADADAPAPGAPRDRDAAP